jgi:hypothetical protein
MQTPSVLVSMFLLSNYPINCCDQASGGSIGSELNCAATIEACRRLRTRMDVVMRMLPAGSNDWMAQCAAGGQAALDMTGLLYI